MGTTFFSYSRSDSDFVLNLAKDLRHAGIKVWLDQLDIPAGSHWDSSIQKALETSDTLLIVLSPASVASENVMDEVSFALEEGKQVIPVLKEECEVPFRLRRVQRIDFTGDYNSALEKLQNTITGSVQESESASEKSKQGLHGTIKNTGHEMTGKATRSFSKPLLGGALVLILGLLVYFVFFNKTPESDLNYEDQDNTAMTVTEIDKDSYYYIQNRHNGRYLSVVEGSVDDGAYIVVVESAPDELEEFDKFHFNGTGPYSIICKVSRHLLSIDEDNFVRQLRIPEQGIDQLYHTFKLNELENGYFQFEVLAESGKVLGLDPASEDMKEKQGVISIRNDMSLHTQWKLIHTGEQVSH